MSTIDSVSTTELNQFARSPQSWYFYRVGLADDNYYTTRGVAYHDFAEYYLSNPEDALDQLNSGEAFATAREAVAEHADAFTLEEFETEFYAGVEALLECIDSVDIQDGPPSGYADDGPSETLYGPADHPRAEAGFESDRIHGRVDFIPQDDWLIDFKSGRYKSESAIFKRASIEDIHPRADFQAPLYLLHHSRHHGGDCEISFYYFNDLVNDILVNREYDWTDALSTIPYHDQSLEDFVASKQLYDHLITGVSSSNDRRKTLGERMNYDDYRLFMDKHTPPDFTDKDTVLNSSFCETFKAYGVSQVGDHKYVKNGIESALKKIVDYRTSAYFKSDLKQFESFLTEQLEAMNRCLDDNEFPVRGSENLTADELSSPDLIRSIGVLQ